MRHVSYVVCTRCVFLECLFIFVLAFNGCSRAAWSTEEAISQSLRACDLMSRKCSGRYELVPRADDVW